MNFENLKAKTRTVLNIKNPLKFIIGGITAGILSSVFCFNVDGKSSIIKPEVRYDECVYATTITEETITTSKSTTSVSTTTETTTTEMTTMEETTVVSETTTEKKTETEYIFYVPEETTVTTLTCVEETYIEENVSTDYGITEYEKRLLAEITCHEYGSDWVSTAEKAKIVAGVMNRVYSEDYPDNIYDVLMQDGQFHGSWDGGHGYWPGCIEPNEDSWAAVDYYFSHQSEFGSYTSWSGDGTWNYFY